MTANWRRPGVLILAIGGLATVTAMIVALLFLSGAPNAQQPTLRDGMLSKLVNFAHSATNGASAERVSAAVGPTFLNYVGAARITQGTVGESRPAWTKGVIHVVDDGIWMSGHEQHFAFGKYALPEIWAKTYKRNQMPYLQNTVPFVAIDRGGAASMTINGILQMPDQLLISAAIYYDANGGNVRDMFSFVDGVQSGYFKVDGGAKAAGWMCKTPARWVAEVGEYYMGYSSNIPINSRLSHGPSLFGWDGNTAPVIKTRELMVFPLSAPMGEHSATGGKPADPIWNVLSAVSVAFIHGEDYIAIGRTGGLRSGIGYKEILDDAGKVIRKDGGWLTYEEGDNNSYYWKFKMRDILDAESPELPRPYEYGVLDVPHSVHGGSYADGHVYLFDKAGAVIYNYEVKEDSST